MVVGAGYVWFVVPETEGVPLEQMANAFGHEDLVKIEPIESELGQRLKREGVDKEKRELDSIQGEFV